MLDNSLYRVGQTLLSGTPLEELGWRLYARLRSYRETGSVSGVGTYEVQPYPDLDPYPLVMDRLHCRIVGGEFEPEVFETPFEYGDSDTTYGEVGARWGIFSFALSPRVDRVRAFERDPHLVYLLSQSRTENDAENVGIVGADLSAAQSLDAYGPPSDVVTVDIEGGEYDVLPASTATLAAGPVWIVEAHQFDGLTGDPADLVALFEEYDYTVDRVEEDGPRCRLVAVP
jgi:hypothetical protein